MTFFQAALARPPSPPVAAFDMPWLPFLTVDEKASRRDGIRGYDQR
jgi:hypothetical protein